MGTRVLHPDSLSPGEGYACSFNSWSGRSTEIPWDLFTCSKVQRDPVPRGCLKEVRVPWEHLPCQPVLTPLHQWAGLGLLQAGAAGGLLRTTWTHWGASLGTTVLEERTRKGRVSVTDADHPRLGSPWGSRRPTEPSPPDTRPFTHSLRQRYVRCQQAGVLAATGGDTRLCDRNLRWTLLRNPQRHLNVKHLFKTSPGAEELPRKGSTSPAPPTFLPSPTFPLLPGITRIPGASPFDIGPQPQPQSQPRSSSLLPSSLPSCS